MAQFRSESAHGWKMYVVPAFHGTPAGTSLRLVSGYVIKAVFSIAIFENGFHQACGCEVCGYD